VKLLLGLFVMGTIESAGQAGFLTEDFGLLKVDCAITVSELLFWNLNSHISNATWIILCGSSGDVTRLDGSEIGCQPHIFVFHRFSSLLLPLHPSLFWRFV